MSIAAESRGRAVDAKIGCPGLDFETWDNKSLDSRLVGNPNLTSDKLPTHLSISDRYPEVGIATGISQRRLNVIMCVVIGVSGSNLTAS
jgi:hypothetical protein